MPSAFRTQKNLPEWVELDYHRRDRKLRRWRRVLTWGTLAACVIGVSFATVLPGSRRAIQAGPLSFAHSMFNDECSRCHQESFQTAKKFVGGDAHGHVVPNQACIQCHDGPHHNAFVGDEIACATCHREHRGRVALSRVSDGQCTECHAALKNHRKGGADGMRVENTITSFASDHPKFGVQRSAFKDPCQLHFNHQLHLKSEGVLVGPGKEKKILQCIDCHLTDSAGRHMQKINYEKHCSECHPLAVQLTGTFAEPIPDEMMKAIRDFNTTPAPHREPAVVRAVLRERLLDFIQKQPILAGEKSGRLVDPDNFGPPTRRTRSPSELEWRWTRERLGHLERYLFPEEQRANSEQVLFQKGGGCRLCHVEEKKRPVNGAELTGLPVFERTNSLSRWMPLARFNHEKHRMLNCTECHDARTSKKTSDVLMPGIESCRKCHNPTVGVRHDCAGCHNYHDRTINHDRHKSWTIQETIGKP